MRTPMNTYFFLKGRVALYAILKAIKINQGDEIILPGFTCIVVPNAITYLGARPIYVDINPETYNIDPQKIEEKITEKTKAIVVQHTFGIPAEMDAINDIAKRYNLYVIEDSCHAIGSKYKGEKVGTFGDAAFFSSQWSKPITTGLGGWAVINNEQLLEKMEKIYQKFTNPSYRENLLLRLQYLTYSRLFKSSLFWFAQDSYRNLSKCGITIGSSSNEELNYKMPDGYEKKMSQWQQNLLKKKFIDINKIIDHRKWVASLYENLLTQKGIKAIRLTEDYEPVFLRYPVLVKNKKEVLAEAKKRRIEIGDWFLSPIHPNLSRWEKVGYQKGMCPIAERTCDHIINLPVHDKIGVKEIDRIVDFIGNL